MPEEIKRFRTGFTPLETTGKSEKRKVSLTGFTLIELIVVLIIVGILAGLAIPNYARTREKALDGEAKSGLRLIQAAERVYQSKFGTYLGSLPNALAISDSNLQLELASTSWNFSVGAAATTLFTACAVRTGAIRTWRITQDTATEPCQTGTPGCSAACP